MQSVHDTKHFTFTPLSHCPNWVMQSGCFLFFSWLLLDAIAIESIINIVIVSSDFALRQPQPNRKHTHATHLYIRNTKMDKQNSLIQGELLASSPCSGLLNTYHRYDFTLLLNSQHKFLSLSCAFCHSRMLRRVGFMRWWPKYARRGLFFWNK